MFNILPKEVTTALEIAHKAQSALEALKAIDADHDGKADLQEILTEAKGLQPDFEAASKKLEAASELLKKPDPSFAEIIAIAKDALPLYADSSKRVERIMQLATLDMKELSAKYDIHLDHLI